MKHNFWKLFWDILSIIIGLFLGFKTFLFCGEKISMFGYFPIGILCGLIVFKLSSTLTYVIELTISWLIFKLCKVKISKDLPF